MSTHVAALQAEMKKKNVDQVAAVGCFPGPTSSGTARLYLNMALTIWMEVPEAEIVLQQPIRNGQATMVWIPASTRYACHYFDHHNKEKKGNWTADEFIEFLEHEDGGGHVHNYKHTRFPYCP